ncbi:hypothetical protein E4K64_33340 [Bradyrhizobium frederickii]|uniref:Uncharacterized protein n=1 Tax=Bradyrhizobium frederickii TaxID=2560054 RepID=A0A4Y9NQA6_9BRAD|nr:hypothetical protein [Bradyrhizobium frederickii]TFV69418.1 hypothetical protein E4K64_33340 [Bradyrhizobium frederickii]
MKSGPKCTVCAHDERWRIELLRAGGASLDSLATKFGLSKDAIGRHWHNHVSVEMKASYLVGPAQLAELAEKAADEGASVLDHFRAVRTMLMSQLAATTEAGDARGAAIVAGQLVGVLEKIGKVTGEIATIAQGTINIQNNVAIVNSPQFAKVQAAILRALAPHGAARAAVVAALHELDAETTADGLRAGRAPVMIDALALPPPCPIPLPEPTP